MEPKKIRGYRLSDEAWLEIKRIAELAGSSEAAVIEGWAEQSSKNWVAGLKAGSALAISPVVKRPAKTVVRDMDLATGRIDRKPITRPNGKL